MARDARPRVPSRDRGLLRSAGAVAIVLGLVLSGLGGWFPVASTAAWPIGHGASYSTGAPSVGRDPGPADPFIPIAGQVHDRITTVPLRAGAGDYLSTRPAWLQYDSVDRAFYVAAPTSSVDILTNVSGRSWTDNATVPVGSEPFGVAFDPTTADVFVTNTGSDNVSVLNGFLPQPIGSFGVGTSPTGIAYDAENGNLYIANSASDNVTVVNATTWAVVANVSVGTGPIGLAADPVSGDVYVANNGSADVSVISGATDQVTATVAVGAEPTGVAIDNATGSVYVSNNGSSNVSVIAERSSTVIATIPVDGAYAWLQGVVYDWQDGLVWIAGGRYAIVVLDPANETEVSVIFYDPSGIAFDPDTGTLCATNSANLTVACLYAASGTISHPGWVTLTSSTWLNFTQTGLPSESSWTVLLAPDSIEVGFAYGAWTTPISVQLYPGRSYTYQIETSSTDWASPSSGVVALGNVPVTIPVVFSNATTYPVNFTETGLPAGSPWTVNVTGEAELATTNATEGLLLGNGSYAFSVVTGTVGFRPASGNGSFIVAGAGVTVIVAFDALPRQPVTFAEQGLPAGTEWYVNVTGQPPSGSVAGSIQLELLAGSYSYNVSSSDKRFSPPRPSGPLTVSGAPVNEEIAFGLVAYRVTFTETGLTAAASWAVTLGNATQSSVNTSIVFEEPNGTYAYAVGGVFEGSASPEVGTLGVVGAPVTRSVLISETPPIHLPPGDYRLVFTETGLGAGTWWGVTIDGIAESAVAGPIEFSGPNGSYEYVAGSVPGYEATDASGSVRVQGSNASIAITFQSSSGPGGTSNGSGGTSSTLLGLPEAEGWAVIVVGIAVAALAAAVVGYAYGRRRGPRVPPGPPGQRPP